VVTNQSLAWREKKSECEGVDHSSRCGVSGNFLKHKPNFELCLLEHK